MIRVLVLSSDTDGVGYYRLLMPHTCLKGDPEVKVDIRLLMDSTLQLLNPEFLKYYNIIVYNKNIPFANEQIEMSFYNLCQQLNIKIIYDVDDFWILDPTHLNYKNWIKSRSGEKTEEMIKKADVITTTTSLFVNDILPLNKNVTVLKNAINMEEQQWVSNKYPSDKIRFIWGGGISHIVDIRLLKEEFKKFDKNFLYKAQFYMCGYDLRIKMNDGSIRKDNHNRSQWGFFEDIFSNNGKYIKTVPYRDYLKNSSNFDDDPLYGRREEFMDEFYQRRHTKPILHFGTMYNEADVSIAPLKNNHSFNYHKSELKLIEAGVHKIPCIMSDYGPYQLNDVEGKNGGKQKGWLIDERKGNWYEKMRWYVDNPSAVKEHGEANHEYFLENFEMKVVNRERVELYKHIAGQERGNVKLD